MTPGMFIADAASILRMTAWATVVRTNAAWAWPGDVQIVGELSAAGDEGRVLAADGAMSAAEPKACTVGLLRFVSLRAHEYLDPPPRISDAFHRQYMQHVLDAHANRGSRPFGIGRFYLAPNPC